jgi:hypothetical protein
MVKEHVIGKEPFRFVVGTHGGSHSAVWNIVADKKNDYYIGNRGFFRLTKISLHQSRICKVALTNEHVNGLKEQGLDAPDDKASVTWRRVPAPVEDAVHVVSLIFPTDYLRLPAPELPPGDLVLSIEAAPLRKAIEVGFFFSREADVPVKPKFLQIGMPLVLTRLLNGETVWVVAREAEFDRMSIPSEERWAGNVRFHDRAAFLEPGAVETDLITTFWNSPKDGECLRVIEIGGVTASVRAGKPVFRIEARKSAPEGPAC